MSSDAKAAVASHRARRARQGFVRIEFNLRKDDAVLMRGAASALADPSRQAEVRRMLRAFADPPKARLKDLLASAPLDGIDLDRGRDLGRAVDL